MDDFLISQDQIDELLAEIPIEDKIQYSMEKLTTDFDILLQEKPDIEILKLKRELTTILRGVTKKLYPSIEKIEQEYTPLYHRIISTIDNNNVFITANDIMNFLTIRRVGLNSERRNFSRFPVTIEAILIKGADTFPCILSDISTNDVGLFCEERMDPAAQLTLLLTADKNYTLDLLVTRSVKANVHLKFKYLTGSRFITSLSLDDIRNIIKSAYQII